MHYLETLKKSNKCVRDEKLLDIKIAESGFGICWSFTKGNKIVNFYVEGGMPLICKLDEKS